MDTNRFINRAPILLCAIYAMYIGSTTPNEMWVLFGVTWSFIFIGDQKW